MFDAIADYLMSQNIRIGFSCNLYTNSIVVNNSHIRVGRGIIEIWGPEFPRPQTVTQINLADPDALDKLENTIKSNHRL